MSTLCAFLNSDEGGTILFGVTDDNKIAGQTVSDSTRKEISQELRKIERHAATKIKYVPINGGKRQVIIIGAKPGKRGIRPGSRRLSPR